MVYNLRHYVSQNIDAITGTLRLNILDIADLLCCMFKLILLFNFVIMYCNYIFLSMLFSVNSVKQMNHELIDLCSC